MYIFKLLLALLYIVLPLILIIYARGVYIKDPLDKKIWLIGFFVKIFGAIAAVLIYTFYYNGGDTTNFFISGKTMSQYVIQHPEKFFEIMSLQNLNHYNDFDFYKYRTNLIYINDSSSYLITKIALILNLLTYHSFTLSSILCSYFSFFCSWQFYKFLKPKTNLFKKNIGFAIFLIPSVVFWGSGLFKDTFTLGANYLFIVGFVSLFGDKKYNLKYFIFLIVGYLLLINIRSFFLITVIPFVIVWVLMNYYISLKSMSLKLLFVPFFLFFIALGGYISIRILTTTFQELSIENVKDKSKGFQNWHTTLKGSSYSIGTIEYTPLGIAKKIPVAINVTLFRPYITEANKPIIFLSFLQSTFFILLTMYMLMKMKFIYYFTCLLKSPVGFSLLGFSLFFAFVTGFTSFNFGALDRYKIPCLSPYIISFYFVYEQYLKNIKSVSKN